MKLIDTHTHFYLKEFENDFEQTLHRARRAGIARFYMPAIDSSLMDDMFELERLYPGEFFSMTGLRPSAVAKNYLDELKIVEEYLSKRKFVAIGEIGLDFYWDKTFTEEQYKAFHKQMELALHYELPVVIHTRNAMQETIESVEPFAKKGLNGIFHCFGESNETAKKIVDMGFYLGIGGVITYKKANLGEALRDVDVEHIVLETDAPYLSPVPYRGKRNESSYLLTIAEKLAEIKNIPVAEVARITSENAEKIFAA